MNFLLRLILKMLSVKNKKYYDLREGKKPHQVDKFRIKIKKRKHTNVYKI